MAILNNAIKEAAILLLQEVGLKAEHGSHPIVGGAPTTLRTITGLGQWYILVNTATKISKLKTSWIPYG
jgi:hypothetical protein